MEELKINHKIVEKIEKDEDTVIMFSTEDDDAVNLSVTKKCPTRDLLKTIMDIQSLHIDDCRSEEEVEKINKVCVNAFFDIFRDLGRRIDMTSPTK